MTKKYPLRLTIGYDVNINMHTVQAIRNINS